MNLYKTSKWKKQSLLQRKKEPLCRACLAMSPPRLTKSKIADHIRPWRTQWEFFNNPLQSLCQACHNDKTALFDHPEKIRAKKCEIKFF